MNAQRWRSNVVWARVGAAVLVVVSAGCPGRGLGPPPGDPILNMTDTSAMPAPIEEDEVRARLRDAVEQELGPGVWSSDAGPLMNEIVEQSVSRLLGLRPYRRQLDEVERRVRRFAREVHEKTCGACVEPHPTRSAVERVRTSWFCPLWPLC